MLSLQELPNDILIIILANTNISCHVCQKKYNFNHLSIPPKREWRLKQ